MRPVKKWRSGQHGVVQEYNPYSGAKEKLLENFGNEPYYHCSYCDRPVPKVHLEVEHIQPIEHHPELEFLWSNFLISCKNCNLAKGASNVLPANVLLPQRQNTWNCFKVNNDGTMEADPNNQLAFQKASSTVSLLGLDRGFHHPDRQPQDDRYDARRHALLIAKRDLQYYEDGVPNYIDAIVQNALNIGFWYVWMKVFTNHPEVQDELIAWFNNTYEDCRIRNVDRL